MSTFTYIAHGRLGELEADEMLVSQGGVNDEEKQVG